MVKSYQDALRRLWDGLCDVYVLETAVNKANGRDEPTEVQKLHGEPCRLSFSSISSTTEQDSAPLIQQSVKLFISKTVKIPAGSKIAVTQEGRTTAYARSGEPAVYSCQQDFWLSLFRLPQSANTRKAQVRKVVLSAEAGALRTAKPGASTRSP